MSIDFKTLNFQEVMDALGQELKQFKGGKVVTVGIHEGAPQPENGDLNMATLGAVLNFGTQDGHIPERPWLEPGIQASAQEISDTIADAIEGGKDLDGTLEMVGVVASGGVRQYMTDLKTPPNAESTIKRKGSANPLIDTGALRASVTHAITSEKPTEGLA